MGKGPLQTSARGTNILLTVQSDSQIYFSSIHQRHDLSLEIFGALHFSMQNKEEKKNYLVCSVAPHMP